MTKNDLIKKYEKELGYAEEMENFTKEKYDNTLDSIDKAKWCRYLIEIDIYKKFIKDLKGLENE